MSSKLKVENLYYKDILKSINFNVNEGTITALMGKSGSGKTLLFKSIFGLVETSGLIEINGIILTKDKVEEIRKNIGIYLSISNLENKNVFLNIVEPLNNLNYLDDIAKKKVYDISKKLGIENLLYKDICSLSHAQKKVVSFAKCIIHEPKIILIDNLFESLDTYYKNKIIKYLKQIKKSKKCIIIFVTNNSEDLCFSDNLMILKGGKILVNESVNIVLEDESLFTKNSIKLPFLIDLSYKLKAYELIDKLIHDTDEMVDEIWQ